MLTILDRSPGLRPGLNFSLWKKKGPGPGPNRGHSLRRNHPSQRNQQLVRRRRCLTWKGRRPLLTAKLSEVPTDSEIEPLAKHCWPAWGPHWGGGWAAAWPTWTKDTAGRKKFRNDVVAQLAKVGLPKPQEPDAEDQAARERAAAWMDQRLAEAPKRMVDMKCAGCKRKRQLKPGETHCYPCRKLSEDSTLSRDDQDRQLASQPGPEILKADEYEKLLGETIRRYQEAHGPAPEDAKVEAVGAAMASVQGQAAK